MTSTDIALPSDNAMGAFSPEDENIVRYLGLDPRNAAHRAQVAICRHYSFDPVLKHVVVIPKGGVYITRDGLLHVAHRSGQLDGIVVEQEPTLSEDGLEWVARVSVWRKDMTHPFTFPGRYPVKGMNKEYAPEMALKAAEAHALRRAFDITGMPTLDEQRPEEPVRQTATVTVEEIVTQRDDSDQYRPAPRRDPEAEPATVELPEPDISANDDTARGA